MLLITDKSISAQNSRRYTLHHIQTCPPPRLSQNHNSLHLSNRRRYFSCFRKLLETTHALHFVNNKPDCLRESEMDARGFHT